MLGKRDLCWTASTLIIYKGFRWRVSARPGAIWRILTVRCKRSQYCPIFQIHTRLGLGQGCQSGSSQDPETWTLKPETSICGLHQSKGDDRNGTCQTNTDQWKQGNGLNACKSGCFYRIRIWIIFQRDKARPLLVFKLAVVQGPDKHHDADQKTGRHVCNEIGIVHFSLIGWRVDSFNG